MTQQDSIWHGTVELAALNRLGENSMNAYVGIEFIDFGDDWPQGFSATIAPADRRRFRGLDLNHLVAHRVRVRGIVQDYRGRPEIALSNPAQIEVLN